MNINKLAEFWKAETKKKIVLIKKELPKLFNPIRKKAQK